MDFDADQLVTVLRTRSRAECNEAALVLHAVGLGAEVRFEDGWWLVRVAPGEVPEAREQLESYADENRRAPEPPATPPTVEDGKRGVYAYAAVITLFAVLKDHAMFGIDWLAAGRMHAGSVTSGEWWRVVTALTLHVDFGHIASNLVFGAVFGLFAGRYMGSGVAWTFILLSGAFGNALNAVIQPDSHRAVGASTAVFGALGLLAAWMVARRRFQRLKRAERWAPVMGAFMLLAYTGAGGERTDVLAHVTGFLAGGALGFAAGRIPQHWLHSGWVQKRAAALAAIILGLAWLFALAAV